MTAPHPMMVEPSANIAAREQCWGELQTFLEAEIRPGLRRIYDDRIASGLKARLGRDPDRHDIAAAMNETPENKAWYLLRTAAQKMAFDASIAAVTERLGALEDIAGRLANGPAVLELDPELALPSYLDADVHNLCGGYHDRDARHPFAAGAVYDRALSVHRVQAMGPLVDDVGRSIVAAIKDRYPQFQPRRILEMGCTVGHTLVPFKEAWPDAEVIGIDAAAPGLVFGAARASALGAAVTFSQRDAEETGYEDSSFDLVFGRILLHETSARAVPRILGEAHRLLRKGGMFFHSDAPQFDELDPYTQSLRDWDIHCNLEPFMDGFYAMDIEAEMERVGFERRAMFRMFAPSLVVREDYRAQETRSAGRYFMAGSFKRA